MRREALDYQKQSAKSQSRPIFTAPSNTFTGHSINQFKPSTEKGEVSMKPIKLLIAVMFGVTALMTLPIMADDVISSSVNVTPPPTKLNSDEWRSMSLAGNRVLKHTNEALTALADKKNDEALTNISQGLLLVQIIDAALPASTVTTDIKSGTLSYTDNDPLKPAFVPIYREYDTVDVLSPVVEQKQAKAAQSAAVPDVTYAGFDYSGVKLDLRLANRDLQSAQDLIKQGDTKAATAALQDILATGVIFQFSSVDEPLVRAMDNLRLAESELKADHPDEAKNALAGASDALKTYEKMTGDTRSKEVKQLYQELDEETKNVAQEKPETFSPKVSGWWGRIHNWMKF
jgi:hypothetical protein